MKAKYFIIVNRNQYKKFCYVYPIETETELVERVNSYTKQIQRKLLDGTFEVVEIDNMNPALGEIFFGLDDGPHVEWYVDSNGNVFGTIPNA